MFTLMHRHDPPRTPRSASLPRVYALQLLSKQRSGGQEGGERQEKPENRVYILLRKVQRIDTPVNACVRYQHVNCAELSLDFRYHALELLLIGNIALPRLRTRADCERLYTRAPSC
jgi:hypothetical protein